MCWLLAILLLVNAAIFFWFSSTSSVTAVSEVKSDPGVAQLLLLTELDAGPQVLASECAVVGPVVDLATIEQLSATLTVRGVPHQRWSEAPAEGVGEQTYWLQFVATLQPRLERQFWFNILAQSPNTEIIQKTCTAVASTGDLP